MNHGNDAALALSLNLTYMMWVYFEALGTDDFMWNKDTEVGERDRANTLFNDATAISASIDTNTGSDSVDTDGGFLRTNAWLFIAFAYSENGASNDRLRVYVGDSTTTATEATYGSQANGSGGREDNSAADTIIGNKTSDDQGMNGQIAFLAYWDRRLTIDQIREQQFSPHITTGTLIMSFYGFQPAGDTQPDWSGTGNPGTPTNLTGSSNGPPINSPFDVNLFRFTVPRSVLKEVVVALDAKLRFTLLNQNLQDSAVN